MRVGDIKSLEASRAFRMAQQITAFWLSSEGGEEPGASSHLLQSDQFPLFCRIMRDANRLCGSRLFCQVSDSCEERGDCHPCRNQARRSRICATPPRAMAAWSTRICLEPCHLMGGILPVDPPGSKRKSEHVTWFRRTKPYTQKHRPEGLFGAPALRPRGLGRLRQPNLYGDLVGSIFRLPLFGLKGGPDFPLDPPKRSKTTCRELSPAAPKQRASRP